MNGEKVFVIGASEGGVQAVVDLVSALPAAFPVPVFVVVHIGAHRSELPALLNVRGDLHAAHARDAETIRAGKVYVAPPDYHMLVGEGIVGLTKGPRENFARPSIDPLFRSAAESYGSGAIGVILTGGLNDGVAGLFEIKRRGGIAVVQDPDDAVNPSMPRSALAHVAIDHCTPLAMMPALLVRLAAAAHSTPIKSQGASEGLETDMSAHFSNDRPVTVTCPDCGGALRQSQLGTLTQFRCHIGHVYTTEAMLDGQFIAMERSIESGLRALNERAELCRQMARNAVDGDDPATSADWKRAMDDAEQRAEALRELLEREWTHPEPRDHARAAE